MEREEAMTLRCHESKETLQEDRRKRVIYYLS